MTIVRITALADVHDAFVSGLLIEAAGLRVLVDPGALPRGTPLLPPALASVERLDAIVLSHAHADHTAGLPVVRSAFPTTPILATPSTLALLQAVDSLADGVTSYVQALPFKESAVLGAPRDGRAWTVQLLQAGHILGAAMIVFETPEGCVVCSGDVCTSDQYTTRRAARPRQRADVLVLESTLGDRHFRTREGDETHLVNQVRTALEQGGHVLIAAPPLGKAQEILLTLLRARLDQQLAATVYIDETIASVNRVYARFAPVEYLRLAHWMDRYGDPFSVDGGLVALARLEDYVVLHSGQPSVMLVALANFRAGNVRLYARLLAAFSGNLIFVPAGRGARHYVEQVVRPTRVHCAVGSYGFTAHASGEALAALAARWQAGLVILTHGEPEAQERLQERLARYEIAAVRCGPGQHIDWPGPP